MKDGQTSSDDEKILADALFTLKGVTKYYDDSVLEAATPDVRRDFTQLHADEREAAHQVWKEMNRHGWYSTKQADATKISELQNTANQIQQGGIQAVDRGNQGNYSSSWTGQQMPGQMGQKNVGASGGMGAGWQGHGGGQGSQGGTSYQGGQWGSGQQSQGMTTGGYGPSTSGYGGPMGGQGSPSGGRGSYGVSLSSRRSRGGYGVSGYGQQQGGPSSGGQMSYGAGSWGGQGNYGGSGGMGTMGGYSGPSNFGGQGGYGGSTGPTGQGGYSGPSNFGGQGGYGAGGMGGRGSMSPMSQGRQVQSNWQPSGGMSPSGGGMTGSWQHETQRPYGPNDESL